MRKLVYYVASSIDGFIAGPDGQYDFFPFEGEFQEAILAEFPETMPGHLRGHFGVEDAPNRRFDTLIMGRGTYEPALAYGITSPYPHLRQYVASRSLSSSDPAITVTTDPLQLVKELKQEDGLDIWLCGGGDLAGQLVSEIDELIVKLQPVVVGAGVPLFGESTAPTSFTLIDTRRFAGGQLMLSYTA